ncbi:transcription factor bHLH130-like [Lotus japonicus]|uniref:transcription factor bHLH130-like n=1 Tax=Lotus japonicus TaxID=34305 RepID=UPI002583B03C|nr:transcription factor bHLH130-like [Lotus japonicus]
MDSNSRYQLQPNSGFLRFRSTLSSPQTNLKQGEGGAAANNGGGNQWGGFEPERLVPQFMNSGNTERSHNYSEFVNEKLTNHNSSSSSPSSLSRMNFHLLRQSSSAAAHFSNIISFQNGHDTTKGVGNYGGVNDSDGEQSLSMNRLNNQISNGDTRNSGLRFPYDSWNETSFFSDKHIDSNKERNGDDKLLSDAQNGELGNQVHTLTHHLSLPLPRKSSQLFAMDNLLEFTDSVPTNVRAKRGFATHPRSIAERVRRTRISERIRKLQELVPNLDKQTSTAEMLDLAAVYINDLQKQFKTLSEKRAKCKCTRMHTSESNQIA